jgi:hypothetical protein
MGYLPKRETESDIIEETKTSEIVLVDRNMDH